MSRSAPGEGSSLQRRHLLAFWLGGALPAGAASAQPQAAADSASAAKAMPAALDALRAGGVALLLRHAQTTPGIGDPPEFRAGECGTQRNLSDAGRAEARRIGAWFAQHRLLPSEVRSSAWCRCIDTARLAFGSQRPWPALDSSFGRGGAADDRVRLGLIDEALRAIPAGRFEVWVTHQVNITAATGAYVGMGEGVLVRAGSRTGTGRAASPAVLARMSFDA